MLETNQSKSIQAQLQSGCAVGQQVNSLDFTSEKQMAALEAQPSQVASHLALLLAFPMGMARAG